MKAAACLVVLALAAALAADAPPKTVVAVFDFACPESPVLGSQLADSVRLRLSQHKEFEVIDKLTMAEATPKAGLTPQTPETQVTAILKDRLAAHVAIVGSVQKAGGSVRAEVRCVRLSAPATSGPATQPAQGWSKVFSDDSERARGELAKKIVEALREQDEWRPPEYGDEPEPRNFGKPLNLSGGFEDYARQPNSQPIAAWGWDRPDNVSTSLVKDPRPGQAGQVLRIFTDLEREAWLKYQQDLRLGKADPDKPPRIGTVDNKYATVAGLEGVHFRSQWIDARPGQRHWLAADVKGKSSGMFFPKIFVKGFANFSCTPDGLSDVSLNDLKMTADDFARLSREKRESLVAEDARRHPERYRREVYRWYLSCRDEENTWRHYAAPFPPRGGLPANVQYLRIEVYAYWPPGEFLFDNVHLYADPSQKAPLPEEKARTPQYKPTTTQPAPTPRE